MAPVPSPTDVEPPVPKLEMGVGKLSVGADRDMMARLGDPRAMAVLVRYEAEFDALFDHYHTVEPDDTQYIKRMRAAAPFCFSGRQPGPSTPTMSYLDFLRSVRCRAVVVVLQWCCLHCGRLMVLSQLCETGLLPQAMFGKSHVLVRLMELFLGCFPLLKALRHEPVCPYSTASVRAVAGPSTHVLSLQRGSSLSHIINLSVLRELLGKKFADVTSGEASLHPRFIISTLRERGSSPFAGMGVDASAHEVCT